MIRAALLASMIIAGGCSLYEGALHGWEYYQFVTSDQTAVGQVLDRRSMEPDSDFSHTVTFSYRYRQTAGDGPTTVTREQGVEEATYHSLREGDPVRVVYWSSNPIRGGLEGNHASLPRALSSGAVGFFFLGVGAWGFRRGGSAFLALPARKRRPEA